MPIQVYLNFNGNCRQAVTFYAEVFNTKLQPIMTFAEGPEHPDFPLPEEAKDLVMHTFLEIEGSKIMFSDTFPGSPYTLGNHVSMTVISDSAEKLTNYFNRIKVNGQVEMELQETFWSPCYGMVTDQFGIGWQFSQSDEQE
jgi:PhnB protein